MGDELYERTYKRVLYAIKHEVDAAFDEYAGRLTDVLIAVHGTLAQEVGRFEKLIEIDAKRRGLQPPDLIKARRERIARGRGMVGAVSRESGDN